MNENEIRYATAALHVFKRFGVRKATMEEIAIEAGVSKPTLYATFRNKDQALAGTIRLAKGAAINAVSESWKNVGELDGKLDILFEKLVVAGYDLLHNSPDAEAFDHAIGDASREAIAETRRQEAVLLAGVFANYPGLTGQGTTAESYANFVVAAAMQAKSQSQNRAALLAFLRELKLSILAVAQTD